MSVGEVVVKEIYATQMTVNARGFHFNLSPFMNPLFQSSLEAFTRELESSHQNIWAEIDQTQSADFSAFNTERYINTWEMLDGDITLHARTLIDAVGTFIDQVRFRQSRGIVQANNQSDVVGNIFYVFRNGIGEMIRMMEKSRNMFATNEAERLNQQIRNYYLFPIVGVLILLFFVLLLTPLLLAMLHTNSQISAYILGNPISLFFEQKQKVVDRLMNRYEIQVDYSIDKPFRGTRKVVRFTNPVQTNGVAVASFVIATSLFYCIMYFEMFLALTNTLKLAPDMVNSYSEYMASLSQAYLWGMEVRHYNTPNSINEFVPSFLLAPDPGSMETAAISGMDKSINKVMREFLNGYPLLDSHFDFLYRGIYSDYGYMRKGMRNAAKALKWDLFLCMTAEANLCNGLLSNIYSVQTVLANNSLTYINYFKDDSSVVAYQQIEDIEGALISFTASLLVYIVFYVLVVNRREYKRTKALWKLCSLLPSKATITMKGKKTAVPDPSAGGSHMSKIYPSLARPKVSL